MIMKKFEMLDKMMEASRQGLFKEPKLKPPKKRAKRDKDDYAYERPMTPPAAEPEQPLGPDQVLNEHQLSLLFKMTSTFNVPTDGFVESSYEGYFDALQLEEDEESYDQNLRDFLSSCMSFIEAISLTLCAFLLDISLEKTNSLEHQVQVTVTRQGRRSEKAPRRPAGKERNAISQASAPTSQR